MCMLNACFIICSISRNLFFYYCIFFYHPVYFSKHHFTAGTKGNNVIIICESSYKTTYLNCNQSLKEISYALKSLINYLKT